MSRRVLLIGVGAAGLLLVLWLLLLWGPQGGRISDAEDRQAAAEAENSSLELRLSRLQAAQERAPELMATVGDLRRAVPDGPELAQFILDANDIANTSGVDFLSISPSVPEQGLPPLPAYVRLSISVDGSYESVLEYLRLLEGLPRIVVIDSLGLTPGEDGVLAVAVTARMFSTSAPQLVDPAAAAPAPTTTVPPASPEAEQPVTTSTSAAPVVAVSNG